ncbi:General secretion pathway protein L [Shigella boydii ATCC 9905]|nr:General secretion pathway protein L [Shigella boydii ATCC 9905]
MSINIDGRDCCQTGQFSQDVADGALTVVPSQLFFLNIPSHRQILRQN